MKRVCSIIKEQDMMSSKEGYLVKNGNQSTSISSSPASSRSSSRASSTPNSVKTDERLCLAEDMINQFKDEEMIVFQEQLNKDINTMLNKMKAENQEYLQRSVDTCFTDDNNKTVATIRKAYEEAQDKILTEKLLLKAKLDFNNAVKKKKHEMFAIEWSELASDYTENVTEDIEIRLWSEMTAKLQDVYRIYRNTASDLKLNKQANIEMTEDRLESLLTEVQLNNNERIQYFNAGMEEYLNEETKRRENNIQKEMQLEMRTMKRELAQLKNNADRLRMTNSSACIIL
ncbi:uncharacterized protein LOC144744090 [Ciona intestinalis]